MAVRWERQSLSRTMSGESSSGSTSARRALAPSRPQLERRDDAPTEDGPLLLGMKRAVAEDDVENLSVAAVLQLLLPRAEPESPDASDKHLTNARFARTLLVLGSRSAVSARSTPSGEVPSSRGDGDLTGPASSGDRSGRRLGLGVS
mmetsp:Transcript_29966/g.93785  ORF Transcript_29966/g.93785 Transcript_29966/m.93785 type:complete len:147 (-) Transcript_29966:125-565(-)